jgi:hypothetical protein
VLAWCLFTVNLMVSIGIQAPSATEFMPVDEVKVGMKGVGKTVFSGTRIEEFQVEILGVMENSRPHGDIILARVSGGPLATTNMIQGMSGSPVYIGGKLLGAAAFAWAFSKDPICGITPIEEMLYMWRQMEHQETAPWEESLLIPFRERMPFEDRAMRLPGAQEEDTAMEWPQVLAAKSGISSPVGLVPIGTPVMVSGFDQRVIDQMAPVFEQFHMSPIQAGSGAGKDADIKLEPGASLAVQLVSGDVNLSAVGTLTYREGDRIIGFGHPLFSSGGVDYPMAGAVVHSVMPSLAASFKLASVSDVMGVLQQDRRPGVAGTIGSPPTTVPLELWIGGPGKAQSQRFQFDIIHSRFFTPSLVMWAVTNSFMTTGQAMGDATVRMDARLSLEEQGELRMENVFSGSSPHALVATELSEIIALLLSTPLQEVRLKGIGLDIEVESRRLAARITGARLDKGSVRPGEKVQATIFIRPHRGEERAVRTSIEVPQDTPPGRLVVFISDAESSISWEQRRAPHQFQFQSIPHLLEVLRGLAKNDQLVLKLVTGRAGAVVMGRELPSLPPSALAALRGSLTAVQGGLTYQEVLEEKRLDTDFVLSGHIALPLEVER